MSADKRDVVVRTRWRYAGRHVHARVFVGPDYDHLALAGTLVFGQDEWPTIEPVLEAAGQIIQEMSS